MCGQVWDGSSDASISFSRDDGSPLALIVENELIQASLERHLPRYENVRVFYSSTIKDVTNSADSDYVRLQLNDDSTMRAKLLIGELN